MKPFQSDHIASVAKSPLNLRVERLEGLAESRFWFVSKSKAMDAINQMLTQLKREMMQSANQAIQEPVIFLKGQEGSGKEGIARMIHVSSLRGKGPWIAVEGPLVSEELFGSKAALGFIELAQGGTIYLNEVGLSSLEIQSQLFEFLQTRKFKKSGQERLVELDVRVILGSSQDLESLAREGKFLEKLYQFLSPLKRVVPPLRERLEDILPMARQFAQILFRQNGKVFSGFTTDAETVLQNYLWPGNVHELWNVMERVALLSKGNELTSEQFLPMKTISFNHSFLNYTAAKKKWFNSFEKDYLISALVQHGGNVSEIAREVKIDRSNLLRLLKKHGLQAKDYRKNHRQIAA